ncbi:MAG: hypothetical protein HFF17_06125 [Oscillospiraceae bacterium]|nr:hypothetical protein [Oscillospiraceae bacterium]
MKRSNRFMALTLALLVAMSTVLPASAAALESSYDEAYYATLDYYGAVLEGGVVKSYLLRGGDTVVDCGEYDEVINLTNSLTPHVENGQVSFQLGADAPEKFYFEGKTAQPYYDLPWTIAVSYRHNGAPALAEDLAGQSGLFEISLDVTPNPGASDYSRTNLVLTAATALNDDEITSLEAPGAEEQLIGNLRTVLFAVLPGEEQHFEIRIGSDDFSFPGLMFLAVPATLDQLDQIADLREAKEDAEDAYHTISDSLDTVLDSLEGVSGSLDAAADGLDQLSAAMAAASASTGPVYTSTDRAMADLNNLAGTLGRLDSDADTASQAVADLTGEVNGLNASVQDLKPELETARKLIAAIQSDADAARALLTDTEDYNERASKLAKSMAGNLADLQDTAGRMKSDLDRLEGSLRRLGNLQGLTDDDIIALLPAEQQAQMRQVLALRGQYEQALKGGAVPEGTSFESFIIGAALPGAYEQAYAAAYQQYCQALAAQGIPEAMWPSQEDFVKNEGNDPTIAAVKQQAESSARAQVEETARTADEAYSTFAAQKPVVDTVNGKIQEVNTMIQRVTGPTASVIDELSSLCKTAEESDDLYDLALLAQDLLKLLESHEGEGAALIGHASEAGDLISRLTGNADTALTRLDSLNGVLNTYEPALQTTLRDAQAVSQSLQSTLRDSATAITALENLMRVRGPQLSAGATAALNGTSAALRDANIDTAPTSDIRDAKSDLTGLIEDQWDAHAGGHDNLLLMDPDAAPESMTSVQNPAPTSIQYVMRTQEIQVSDDESSGAPAGQPAAAPTTFWGRVKAMFQDLWHTITGWFH